ncbi:UNKNOWN [Stylonychia lemnae]|uniref:Uncharacterized protein n=1 Tax=Stylonychia lemnae TaxID=5949 RepID=A0A078B9V7_STYLE|nr:UNKNOWN [Stylonychia lemnae]|eukprot:CDW91300.1 UNKNOWN [Stylonychia lemnae]
MNKTHFYSSLDTSLQLSQTQDRSQIIQNLDQIFDTEDNEQHLTSTAGAGDAKISNEIPLEIYQENIQKRISEIQQKRDEIRKQYDKSSRNNSRTNEKSSSNLILSKQSSPKIILRSVINNDEFSSNDKTNYLRTYEYEVKKLRNDSADSHSQEHCSSLYKNTMSQPTSCYLNQNTNGTICHQNSQSTNTFSNNNFYHQPINQSFHINISRNYSKLNMDEQSSNINHAINGQKEYEYPQSRESLSNSIISPRVLSTRHVKSKSINHTSNKHILVNQEHLRSKIYMNQTNQQPQLRQKTQIFSSANTQSNNNNNNSSQDLKKFNSNVKSPTGNSTQLESQILKLKAELKKKDEQLLKKEEIIGVLNKLLDHLNIQLNQKNKIVQQTEKDIAGFKVKEQKFLEVISMCKGQLNDFDMIISKSKQMIDKQKQEIEHLRQIKCSGGSANSSAFINASPNYSQYIRTIDPNNEYLIQFQERQNNLQNLISESEKVMIDKSKINQSQGNIYVEQIRQINSRQNNNQIKQQSSGSNALNQSKALSIVTRATDLSYDNVSTLNESLRSLQNQENFNHTNNYIYGMPSQSNINPYQNTVNSTKSSSSNLNISQSLYNAMRNSLGSNQNILNQSYQNGVQSTNQNTKTGCNAPPPSHSRPNSYSAQHTNKLFNRTLHHSKNISILPPTILTNNSKRSNQNL